MEINIRNDALFKEMQNSCFYRLWKKEKEHKKNTDLYNAGTSRAHRADHVNIGSGGRTMPL